MSKTTELLTTDGLADRLQVRPATVRIWARQGKIPTIRLSAKVIRYDLADVVAATQCTARKAVGDD